MSYKPDEIELINYMYGELSAEDRKKVEAYLKKHPDAAKEITGFDDTRKILAAYRDKEVIPPVSMQLGDSKPQTNRAAQWPRILAVAASVSLLLIVGYITDFKFSYNDDGLFIGFKSNIESSQSVSIEEIELLLNEAMERNLVAQNENLIQVRQELWEGYTADFEKQRKAINTNLQNKLKLDKQVFDKYAKDLEGRQVKLVNSYFENAGIEQQTYVRNLLVDFTSYLEEQRVQDRDFYLNRLIDLKLSSDLKQQETEQMLTSIIKSVNSISNEETTQNF